VQSFAKYCDFVLSQSCLGLRAHIILRVMLGIYST
jgi:hypothetical protein